MIPSSLRSETKFIVYQLIPVPNGKPDKRPLWNWSDPARWLTAEAAEYTASTLGADHGVGYVFTEDSGRFFFDLDACRNRETGEVVPIAQWAMTTFAGAYHEVSVSGTGIHVLGSYTGPRPAHGCRNGAYGAELYTGGRWVALGTPFDGTGSVLADCTPQLNYLIATFFPAAQASVRDSEWTDRPTEDWRGPKDDTELIRRAMASQSTSAAFGGKASFRDLWTANATMLAANYPDANGRPWDYSKADQALAQHLAFWTGCDCSRIERLMRASGLNRDKYDREDYLPRTISFAVSRQEDVLQDKPAVPVTVPNAQGVPQSLTVPSGTAEETTPDDFWADLASHRYIHRPTRDLWSVDAVNGNLRRFKEQLGMPPAQWLDLMRYVKQTRWQPGYPEIIEGVIEDQGVLIPNPKGRIYNLYRETDAVATDGDVTPWLQHMQYLYPTDWEYILQWMAYRVQNPGEKINHALVIGGIPRTGKDMILTPLKYGVGKSNFKSINPQKLFKDFTDFVECTLLVINEAKDLGDIDRYTFENTIKQYIAAPPATLTCNKKNLHPYEVPNVMAVVITTNFKLDGLYIPPDDGRYYVAWSDSQRIAKDGYYDQFWKWLENGGQQACYGYLRRLDVSSFRPKDNPPRTEAWYQIVASGRNPDEIMLADVLEGLQIATVREIVTKLQFSNYPELLAALTKGGRRISTVLSRIGMDALPNPHSSDGRWRLGDGNKDTLYVNRNLPPNERMRLANEKTRS